MPATKADVDELRAIQRHVAEGKLMTTRERMLHDALARAIGLLEHDMAPTVTQWILGALHASVRRSGSGKRWFIIDDDLYEFAMTQLEDIYGPTNPQV